MAFFGRKISDLEWATSVEPVLDAVLGPAAALGDAIRGEDTDGQIEAIGAIILHFPSLKDALKSGGSPSSKEARHARKTLELALKDYTDGAKQGQKLFGDLQKGLAGRLTSSGFAGRAAGARVAFQMSVYHDIVKKAEGRLEEARTFLEEQARGTS